MEFTINGRKYEVTSIEKMGTLASADFSNRGFEGIYYFAKSLPIGRQRKTFTGMFFRNRVTGEFISAT